MGSEVRSWPEMFSAHVLNPQVSHRERVLHTNQYTYSHLLGRHDAGGLLFAEGSKDKTRIATSGELNRFDETQQSWKAKDWACRMVDGGVRSAEVLCGGFVRPLNFVHPPHFRSTDVPLCHSATGKDYDI